MSSSSLDAAMDRYACGDDSAFAEVYDGLAPRLLAFVRRRAPDEASAEEIVQQTFLQMHLSRERYATGFPVLPWAFAIARRLRIDAHRRSKPESLGDEIERVPATDASQEETLERRRLVARLRRSLDELPENQREAFELVKLQGLSHARAALLLGTTATAMKLRVHRASQKLRLVATVRSKASAPT
jgi:RNA polymerase sigma-70 factor (ECF subfamily)